MQIMLIKMIHVAQMCYIFEVLLAEKAYEFKTP